MTTAKQSDNLLPHLFRQEYAKMTAVLCRHFGLDRLETAEDIVSETFLKATETWPVNGIPPNPEAWLYTVAKNKTRDRMKRQQVFDSRVKDKLGAAQGVYLPEEPEFNRENIADSQLAMIFAVSDVPLAEESRICLALQVLCGFSIEEIAHAFMCKAETIKKRLFRARAQLRASGFSLQPLSASQILRSLDTVLRTLYLFFNEGYYSQSGSRVIRKELCSEAMRLLLVLCESPLTNTPQTYALMALLCFQSSRLAARLDAEGLPLRFDEQDRDLWDRMLIDRGNGYLVKAAGGPVSKYHLEAAIAYWHVTAVDEKKWPFILQLYNELVCMDESPTLHLARVYACAKVHGTAMALAEALRLNYVGNRFYEQLMGFLYTSVDPKAALRHLGNALLLSSSALEKAGLQREMDRLQGG